jgi:hypothetical protein
MVHTVDEDIFLFCEEGDLLSSCCKYLQTELQHQPEGDFNVGRF